MSNNFNLLIHGNYLKVEVIRSNRKTISMEIAQNLDIVVRAPFCVSQSRIQELLIKKSNWITKTSLKIQEKNQFKSAPKFTVQELSDLKRFAQKDIMERVIYFASKMNVTYNKIGFGFQKSRWGSCSSKGNIRFNCLLMCIPAEVRDYVVVHELCHRKHMDHSTAFWSEVEKTIPDFKKAKQWLKENGSYFISRIP